MEDLRYSNEISKRCKKIYQLAVLAKSKVPDATGPVEPVYTSDMAERIAHFLKMPELVKIIQELAKEKLSRVKMVLRLVNILYPKYKDSMKKIELVDLIIRGCLGVLTEGITSCLIEGIVSICEGKNSDGSKYLELQFSGPIRSAGGTAQTLVLLVAEVLRKRLGYAKYIPTKQEILRYTAECLRYARLHPGPIMPSVAQIKLVVESCPLCITGPGTELEEVTGYKYLPRVPTPRIRGGACLIINSGFILKVKKLLKYVDAFGIDWPWLNQIPAAGVKAEKKSSNSPAFMNKFAMGRPLLSMTETPGNFRVLIGRSRNTGHGTVGIHPACFELLEFMNTGSQIIMGGPGKGGALAPVSTMEPPVVRLKNGEVLKLTKENCKVLKSQIDKILDLGTILIAYGEYLENGVKLPELDNCEKYWKIKSENAVPNLTNFKIHLKFCKSKKICVHPKYTGLISNITVSDLIELKKYYDQKIEYSKVKHIWDSIAATQKIIGHKYVLDSAIAQFYKWAAEYANQLDPTGAIHVELTKITGVEIKKRGLHTAGFRMGRAESAHLSIIKIPFNGIFEILDKAPKHISHLSKLKPHIGKYLRYPVKFRECSSCGHVDKFPQCPKCKGPTENRKWCNKCNCTSADKKCEKCGSRTVKAKYELLDYTKKILEISKKYGSAIPEIRLPHGKIRPPIFEVFEKIFLRSKYGLPCFKDGTIKYNASNMALTHFKPDQIGTSVEKLKKLGYLFDINGKPLETGNQILQLKTQDVIMPTKSMQKIFLISKFIDELVVKYYGLSAPYNYAIQSDVIGHLVVAQAPHTATGVVGRIIGHTTTNTIMATPIFHAAKRRNCDGDEDGAMDLLDCLLNYSISYLPKSNGMMMNVPIFIIPKINPRQIDKEAYNVEIVKQYPAEFYQGNFAGSIKLIGTNKKYSESYGYSYETNMISLGHTRNYYKDGASMADKVIKEIEIMNNIRGIDVTQIVEKIISTHMLPDIIGCARSYLKQEFKCRSCDISYRTMLFGGVCDICKEPLRVKLYPNSVRKYEKLIKAYAKKYAISPYLKERVMHAISEIDRLFPVTQNLFKIFEKFKK